MSAIFGIILIFGFMSVAASASAVESGKAAVFASEKIMGKRVTSYFTSISDEGTSPNECEKELITTLGGNGFLIKEKVETDAQRVEAKKLHAVFARYSDMSAIPNDTAVKAARILDGENKTVVTCSVAAATRGNNWAVRPICAQASCKAIDIQTKRRITYASGRACIDNVATEASAVTAIREACNMTGKNIAEKMGLK